MKKFKIELNYCQKQKIDSLIIRSHIICNYEIYTGYFEITQHKLQGV